MSRLRGGRVAGLLLASVALLLVAGILSATVIDPGRSTSIQAIGSVGAAGLGGSAVVDELPTSTSTSTSTATSTVTVAVPSSTTPAPKPAVPGPATSTTARAGARPTIAMPDIAPTSSWEIERNGVTVRLRTEPAAPVAGQPVRLLIDTSSAGACCTVLLDFGDGSQRFTVNNEPRLCADASPFSPGSHRSVATHTYATPGAYKATLSVLSGDLCQLPPLPAPGSAGAPPLAGVSIEACIAVGPGVAGQAGCPPAPTYLGP